MFDAEVSWMSGFVTYQCRGCYSVVPANTLVCPSCKARFRCMTCGKRPAAGGMAWPECEPCYRPTKEFNERWEARGRLLKRWGIPLLLGLLLTASISTEIMMPADDAEGWIRSSLAFLLLTFT